MKKRYFFWFSLAFLAGIVFASESLLLLAIVLFISLFISGFLFRKCGFCKLCLLCALGVFLGFLCFSGQFYMYLEKIKPLEHAVVTVEGRIADIDPGEEKRILVRGSCKGLSFLHEDVSVFVYPDFESDLAYGDTVCFTGTAYPPSPPANFGETDYRYTCMAKDVYASFYLSGHQIRKTGHDFSLLRPSDSAYALRTWVQKKISAGAGEAWAGFLCAMLTGDKSRLSPSMEEALRLAGLSHIVAVSGLHLQIIVTAFMSLLGILKIRRRLFSVSLYILLVWFFVLFTGASPSVLRAALMLTIFFMADFFRRDRDSLTALSATAFFLCLVNPALLFDIGFQLSCSSTFGILLFADAFSKKLSPLPAFLRTGLAVSLSAFLGFAPVAVYHFSSLSLIGILANLLVCPLLPALMLLSLFAVFSSFVPFLSSLLFLGATILVRFIFVVANLCAILPGAVVSLPRPSLFGFFGHLLFIIFLYNRIRQKETASLLALCLCVLLFLGDSAVTVCQKIPATVSFLSVGDGSCTLITYGETALLFDCGQNGPADPAENTLLPYLQRKGIKKIDAAFLTHYHEGHAAGLFPLMQAGYIDTLYLPHHANDDIKPRLASEALDAGVRVRYFGDGDTFKTSVCTISALDGFAGNRETGGLLYRLELYSTRLLLTGEVDQKGMRRLLYRGADLDCDILLLPMHGAPEENLPEFIKAVSPEIGVLSCQEKSALQNRRLLEIYDKKAFPLYRTDQNGTVEIRLFPDGQRHVSTLR